MTRVAAPVNPAAFGDPLALRTAWTPANPESGGSRTSSLVARSPERLEFRPTAQAFAIFGGITAFGLLFAAIGAFLIADGNLTGIGFIIFGFLGAIVGVFFIRHISKVAVFDRREGLFWIGRKPDPHGRTPTDTWCRLQSIHAVQLLRERLADEDGGLLSYELNLVLKDGRRIHVVDHDELQTLRGEAARVAQLLGCKVWDAGEALAATVAPAAAVPAAAAPVRDGAVPAPPRRAHARTSLVVYPLVGLLVGTMLGAPLIGVLFVVPGVGELVDAAVDWYARTFDAPRAASLEWLPIVLGAALGVLVVPLVELAFRRRHARRVAAVQAIAPSLGFRFSAEPEPDAAEKLAAGFPYFSGRMENVISGASGGARVVVGDLPIHMGGKGNRWEHQTAAYFESPALRIPAFALAPETLVFNLVANTVGFRDLDFPSNPQFSKQYHLRGLEEDRIRRLFGDPLLAGLAGRPGLHIRGAPGRLLLYRARDICPPPRLPEFVRQAEAVLRLFENAAREAGFAGAAAPALAAVETVQAAEIARMTEQVSKSFLFGSPRVGASLAAFVAIFIAVIGAVILFRMPDSGTSSSVAPARPAPPSTPAHFEPGPIAIVEGRNLLDDPSFESGLGSWRLESRNVATGEHSAAAARSGTGSLKLASDPASARNGWPGWRTGMRYPLVAGVTYVVRAEAMSPDGASAWIGVDYYDAQGHEIGGSSCGCSAVPPGDWIPLKLTVSAADQRGAAAVQLALLQCAAGGTTGRTTLYFDDVFFGAVAPEAAGRGCAEPAGTRTAAPALPPEPVTGGPDAAVIESVEPSRVIIGQTITLRGRNFGSVDNHIVTIGDDNFRFVARTVAWADDAVTVEIPADQWIPAEGRYFVEVETKDPPALSHRFQFTLEADPCSLVPPKHAAACAEAKAGKGPCARKRAAEMNRCVAAVPDPNGPAMCASLPPPQRARCDAESRAFAECIGIMPVEKADACFNEVVRRELAKARATAPDAPGAMRNGQAAANARCGVFLRPEADRCLLPGDLAGWMAPCAPLPAEQRPICEAEARAHHACTLSHPGGEMASCFNQVAARSRCTAGPGMPVCR